MSLSAYLEKLRRKPEHQREKIAVFATAAAFVVVFAIWLMSFSETSKAPGEEQGAAEAVQLEDLQDSLSRDRQSIEEMMESLPEEELGAEGLEDAVSQEEQSSEQQVQQSDENIPADETVPIGSESGAEVPQLP